MEYNIGKPSGLLSKFIKQYWALENCTPAGIEYSHRIVPTGLGELIFYLGDLPESCDIKKPINANTLISGQSGGFYDIRISGRLSVFSILFKPEGLPMFLNIPLNELYNQNVPLKFILNNFTDELESRLFEAKSFTERVIIVEKILLKLLQKKKVSNNFKRIEESVKIINQTRGIVSIDSLSSNACFSRKQFERVFLQHIGTSPKQFLKIVRFQNAINEMSKSSSVSFTNLAYLCGYYDQSHMINDFQKLSGMSPRQYFKECEPVSDYFQY